MAEQQEQITWLQERGFNVSERDFTRYARVYNVKNEYADIECRIKIFNDGIVAYKYWEGKIFYRYNDRDGKVILPQLGEDEINKLDDDLCWSDSVEEFLLRVADFLKSIQIQA
ncbi:MAG: hypothetical protein QW319_04735 [Candidatus Nitrosocaldus sp.]